MPDVEFFFDPVCPWAWITSRWVKEVQDQRGGDVDWRFIALAMVNEQRDHDTELPTKYRIVHHLGRRLLRVAAAAKAEGGSAVVDRVYTAFGTALHVERRSHDEVGAPEGLRAALSTAGLGTELAAAADEERWDEALRADTAEALARTGDDVGTPILTFGPPDGPSFFGPVISRIPRGAEAVELWETVERLVHVSGFAELKRARRDRPQTA